MLTRTTWGRLRSRQHASAVGVYPAPIGLLECHSYEPDAWWSGGHTFVAAVACCVSRCPAHHCCWSQAALCWMLLLMILLLLAV